MTVQSLTALLVALAGVIGAATALLSSLKAHSRITAMQQQQSPGGPPSPSQQPPRLP